MFNVVKRRTLVSGEQMPQQTGSPFCKVCYPVTVYIHPFDMIRGVCCDQYAPFPA